VNSPFLRGLRTGAAAILLGAAGLAAACAPFISAPNLGAETAFYATPDLIHGSPGSLVRSEPIAGAPEGAMAYRVLYRSAGLRDEPILVSGVVVVPSGPVPEGGRPVVAWAHPTTGVVPRCAPSLAFIRFWSIQGLREMLDRGFVVTATDYPGLGTAGPHPYLVGVSEARSVIDSVRAARSLPGAQAGSRYAVWGHSQGGQAALFSGLLAATYGPELQLAGVAAAAPATDLAALLGDDLDTPAGKNLTAMTLWSWQRVFGAPTEEAVVPGAVPAMERLASECIESIYDLIARKESEKPLEKGFLRVPDLSAAEPWRSLLRANTPGTLPAGMPLLLAQGEADAIVRPEVTRAYMARSCAAGVPVRMLSLPGVGHGFAAYNTAATAVAWMADRLAGLAAPNDCAPADPRSQGRLVGRNTQP
jgi:acetyl esterase/lipase